MQAFSYLCERHRSGFPAEDFLASLEKKQIHAEHRTERVVYVWNDEGDRSVMSRDKLRDELACGHPVTFEIWFPHGLASGCSFRPVAPQLYQTAFNLSDVDDKQHHAIVDFVTSRFRQLALRSEAVVFVIDREGVTADFDWDDFARQTAWPPDWPDMIGLTTEESARIQSHLTGYSREVVGDCTLFSRPPTTR